jgi:glycosyltransferase involved in cell wall biosynthesis
MCVLAEDDAHLFIDELVAKGVPVEQIPVGRDIDLKLSGVIRRTISDQKPDVVHTHLIHADVYGQPAAHRLNVPAVASFHSSNPFYRRAPYRQLVRHSYKHVSKVIAISQHVARFISELDLVDPERVEMVHYGIDVNRWRAALPTRQDSRSDFGFEDDELVVGVASRLFPNKGHDVVIEAFKRLPPNLTATLAVAGTGPLREELERSAEGTNNDVRFLGHVDDVRSLFAAVDVLLFPTQPGFGEGFGLAALEGMASGLPVIASHIDSLPEIVRDAVEGFLVPPTDIEAWVGRIGEIENDPGRRAEMGRAALDRVTDAFTITKMVDRTMDIYRQVA